MEHSRLAPSSASRWVFCPGSVSMEEKFVDTEQQYASEGNAAHFVASELLKGQPCPAVGTPAPNGVILDISMINAAKVFAEEVRWWCAAAPLFIEQRISIPWVHDQCFGTADVWHFDPNKRELHVWDFKYGWLPVEAENNWQCICYAAGILRNLQQVGHKLIAPKLTVVIHIVQPRPYHILGPHRMWSVDYTVLMPVIQQLAESADKALGREPRTITGSHCKYCTARHACISAQNSSLFFCEFSTNATPHELPVEAIGPEIKLLERGLEAIKLRLAGLEAQAIALIGKGTSVPGLTVAPGMGRREWDLPADQVISIGELLGVNLRKEVEPITPTQARDMKIPSNVINQLSSIRSKSQKLIATDKTLAARVFGPNGII